MVDLFCKPGAPERNSTSPKCASGSKLLVATSIIHQPPATLPLLTSLGLSSSAHRIREPKFSKATQLHQNPSPPTFSTRHRKSTRCRYTLPLNPDDSPRCGHFDATFAISAILKTRNADTSSSSQSHKSFRTKQKLAKAQKQNRPVPQWIRLRTDNNIRCVFLTTLPSQTWKQYPAKEHQLLTLRHSYNAKRRHWRKTRLGI